MSPLWSDLALARAALADAVARGLIDDDRPPAKRIGRADNDDVRVQPARRPLRRSLGSLAL